MNISKIIFFLTFLASKDLYCMLSVNKSVSKFIAKTALLDKTKAFKNLSIAFNRAKFISEMTCSIMLGDVHKVEQQIKELDASIDISESDSLEQMELQKPFGMATASFFISKQILDIYKNAKSKMSNEFKINGKIEKYLKKNSLFNEAYKNAVLNSCNLLCLVGSKRSLMSQRIYALLTLNYLNIPGSYGKNLNYLIKLLNAKFFDQNGNLHLKLDANLESIDFQTVLGNFFKKASKSKEEYIELLELVNYHVGDIGNAILEAKNQNFERISTNQLLNLWQVQFPNFNNTIEQNKVINNPLNQDFLATTNSFLEIDFIDPNYSSKQNNIWGKLDIFQLINTANPMDAKRASLYQQYAKQFLKDLENNFLDNHGIPKIFKRDPEYTRICEFGNRMSKEDIISILQKRNKQFISSKHFLQIPQGCEFTEIDKLIYLSLSDVTNAKDKIHLQIDKLIDNLINYRKNIKNPNKEFVFASFFDSNGLLNCYQDKIEKYCEITNFELADSDNIESLRYVNYFLYLDDKVEHSDRIKTGIHYALQAIKNEKLREEYLLLAKSQYEALLAEDECNVFLNCKNFILDDKGLQNIHDHIIKFASLISARLIQSKHNNSITLVDKIRQEAKHEYILACSNIAALLNKYGKIEESQLIISNLEKHFASSEFYSLETYSFLTNLLTELDNAPEVFEADSLLAKILKKDIQSFKQDAIDKAARSAKDTLKIIKTFAIDVDKENLSKYVKKNLKCAIKIFENTGNLQTSKNNSSVILADIIARLSYHVHLLNENCKFEQAKKYLSIIDKLIVPIEEDALSNALEKTSTSEEYLDQISNCQSIEGFQEELKLSLEQTSTQSLEKNLNSEITSEDQNRVIEPDEYVLRMLDRSFTNKLSKESDVFKKNQLEFQKNLKLINNFNHEQLENTKKLCNVLNNDAEEKETWFAPIPSLEKSILCSNAANWIFETTTMPDKNPFTFTFGNDPAKSVESMIELGNVSEEMRKFYIKNIIPINQDKQLNIRDPKNVKEINTYLDNIVSSQRLSEAAKTAQLERKYLDKLNADQFLMEYEKIKDYFNVDSHLDKIVAQLEKADINDLIANLTDRHFAMLAIGIENYLKDSFDVQQFEDRILKIAKDKQLRELAIESSHDEFIPNLETRINSSKQKAKNIASFVSNFFKEKAHYYDENKLCDLALTSIDQSSVFSRLNDLISVERYQYVTEAIEFKAAEILCKRIKKEIIEFNKHKNLDLHNDEKIRILELRNRIEEHVKINASFKNLANGKYEEKYNEFKKIIDLLREQNIRTIFDQEPQAIKNLADKFNLPYAALSHTFKHDEQNKIQKSTLQALSVLQNKSDSQQVEYINEYTNLLLYTNASGKIDIALHLLNGLECIALIASGSYDEIRTQFKQSPYILAQAALVGAAKYALYIKGVQQAIYIASLVGVGTITPEVASLIIAGAAFGFTAYQFYQSGKYWINNVSELIDAIKEGNPHKFGKFSTRIGLDIATPFLIRRINKLTALAAQKGYLPQFMNSFAQGVTNAQQINTQQIASKALEQKFKSSKSYKYFSRINKKSGHTNHTLDKMVSNLSQTVSSEKEIHQVLAKIYECHSLQRKIRVSWLPNPIRYDLAHIFTLGLEKGEHKGLHLDHNGVIENSKKIKFLYKEEAPNGWYRALIQYGNNPPAEKSYFAKNSTPKKIVKDILKLLQKSQPNNIKKSADGKIKVTLNLTEGDIITEINPFTCTIETIYPVHNQWKNQNLYQKHFQNNKQILP